MRLPESCMGRAVAAAAAICVASGVVKADTWNMELKRRETENPQFHDRASYLNWSTSPQRFYAQVGGEGNALIKFPGSEGQAEAFKRIVKKEFTTEARKTRSQQEENRG